MFIKIRSKVKKTPYQNYYNQVCDIIMKAKKKKKREENKPVKYHEKSNLKY